MPERVLLLRLEGPLQSWGVRARWDVRDTQPEPTKSGIVGLLGCALGYRTGDPRLASELDRGLTVGVRVESPGVVTMDYQTIAGFLPTAEGTFRHSGVRTAASLERLKDDPDVTPATIISPRYYLQDSAFLAALVSTDAELLARCCAALRCPKWPIYLGRKCCVPSRPVLDSLTDQYGGVEDALTRHPWEWLAKPHNTPIPTSLTAFIETPFDPGCDDLLTRQDALRINQARQYGFRYVRRHTFPMPGPLQPGSTKLGQS